MTAVCSSVNFCPNLLMGYCDGCSRNHNIWDPRMGSSAFNLTYNNCVWVHLGKTPFFTRRIMRRVLRVFGEIKRVDLVPMIGHPDKGGPYWCGVIHFESIKQSAVDILLSGRAIFIEDSKNKVRFTLFRSEKKEKNELEENQLIAEASAQAQKALLAAKKALRKTEGFVWNCDFVTEEDIWNGEFDL